MSRSSAFALVTAMLTLAILSGMNDEVYSADANYDEARVPAYVLPDPLVMESGARITAPAQWPERRAELLRLFRDHVYGESPGRPERMEFETTAERPAGEGIPGMRREIAIKLTNNGHAHTIPVVMYVPTIGPGPYPIFVGMHLFDTKAGTPILGQPLRSHFEGDKKARREPDETERAMLDKLPGEKMLAVLLASGYAVATLDAETTAPDDARRWTEGVVRLFLKEGETQPGPKEWGAIGVWAWCLSRALDYFQTDPQINAGRVVAVGHSRMGKTALWAGAQDERFAMVISNNSGCGGAALSKRIYGETVRHINERFPHWFCDEFNRYNDNESALPVDQHELIALSAPRPVYVASAEEDSWADPLGEWLAVRAARPVFEWLGLSSVHDLPDRLPSVNDKLDEPPFFHVRIGKHALSDYDWFMYLDQANRVFYRFPPLTTHIAESIIHGAPRFASESPHLIAADNLAWRVGPSLFLKSRDEGIRELRDTGYDPVNDGIVIYTYQGILADRFHGVLREEYEDFRYLLVDMAGSGDMTETSSAPLWSPNQSRFISAIKSEMLGNEFSVWEVRPEGPRRMQSFDCDTWGPFKPRWLSETEIAFRKAPNGMDSEHADDIKEARALLVEGVWKIVD